MFHSLVVVGASLTACGGKSASGHDPGGGGGNTFSSGGSAPNGGRASNGGAITGGSALGTLNPLDCGAPAQWGCADYYLNKDCRCDATAPMGPEDCPTPFNFSCDSTWATPNGTFGVGCRCDPLAVTPADCAFPEQFTCSDFATSYLGCRCNPDAARSAVECGPDCACGDGCRRFECQSEMPRYGCACQHLACIK